MRMRLQALLLAAAVMGGCGGGDGPGAEEPAAAARSLPGMDAASVTCVHQGDGREFNVGGPVPAPRRVSKINDVPWENLVPGDTVRIHHKPAPYAERLALIRSGTATQPIRICGVPGPQGERPAITGIEATTRTTAPFRDHTVGALQEYGVVTISGEDFGSRIEHVVLEGLRIGDTKTGPGRRDVVKDNAFFTDASGVRRRYDTDAACIRLRQAQNIRIRNNEITNCADGIFAGSVPDTENHIIRNLTVHGNYLHDNGIIDEEGRHQMYLQGIDITVQFNYFGPVRTRPEGAAAGNQLKMRTAGLVVRYNYMQNGARALDLVEPEEHISFIAPWQYARLRAQYLACRHQGCLGLPPAELEAYDARQQQDWIKFQDAYVYGNLLHAIGNDGSPTPVPSNMVHYGFDNSQHDRQPGTLWFFHNTVLWQTDRSSLSVARLFDYGSDFGDAGYYNYSPALRNVGQKLHYITDSSGDTCQTLASGCTDWGPMLQTRYHDFGRMRAFNNALVRRPFSSAHASDFEWTRNRWDKLDITGPMWITAGWDKDTDGDNNGGGFGHRTLPAAHVYPESAHAQAGNSGHHVTGIDHVIAGKGVPIDVATFAPHATSPLRGAAANLPPGLPAKHRPQFSVRLDASRPHAVVAVPRLEWSSLGAFE
jgi:hypothetical protein